MRWLSSRIGKWCCIGVAVVGMWAIAFVYFLNATPPNAAKSTDEELNTQIREAVKKASALSPQKQGPAVPDFIAEIARLKPSLSRLADMTREERQKFVADFAKDLKARQLRNTDAALCGMITKELDAIGDRATAAKACRQFGEIFQDSGDFSLMLQGPLMMGAANCFELFEKPMELKGVTTAGQPFDWEKYRGKVVLVEFWEIACPGCRAMLPDLKNYYARYRDRGFDVVGIALDKNPQKVAAYVRKIGIPWTNIVEGQQPFAVKHYGVVATPTLFLLDKEGKALSLELGDSKKLGEHLAKLFESPS